MKAFVVSVNGERLFTMGIGEDGVLSAIVTWVGDPQGVDELTMHAGGLDSTTRDHVRWSVPNIQVGDRVQIEVIETTEVDLPHHRFNDDEVAQRLPIVKLQEAEQSNSFSNLNKTERS